MVTLNILQELLATLIVIVMFSVAGLFFYREESGAVVQLSEPFLANPVVKISVPKHNVFAPYR